MWADACIQYSTHVRVPHAHTLYKYRQKRLYELLLVSVWLVYHTWKGWVCVCVLGWGGGGGAAGSTHLHLEPATLHVRAHNSNFLPAALCLAFQNLPLYLTGTTILPVRGRQSTCYTTVCYSQSVCLSLYLQVCYSLPLYLPVCLVPVIQPLCLLQSVTLSASTPLPVTVCYSVCLSFHLPVCYSLPLYLSVGACHSTPCLSVNTSKTAHKESNLESAKWQKWWTALTLTGEEPEFLNLKLQSARRLAAGPTASNSEPGTAPVHGGTALEGSAVCMQNKNKHKSIKYAIQTMDIMEEIH